MTSRRTVLAGLLAAGGATAASLARAAAPDGPAAPAFHEPAILDLVSPFPRFHYLSREGTFWLARELERRAGNRLTVLPYVRPRWSRLRDALSALSRGADLVLADVGLESERLPLNGVATLPGFAVDAVSGTRAYTGLLATPGPWREEFRRAGAVPLAGIVLPPEQLVSRIGPLGSAEAFGDALTGAPVRVPGAATAELMARLEADPVFMLPKEMEVAFREETVVAGLGDLLNLRPERYAGHADAISTNGRFGGFALVLAAAEPAWSELRPDLRTIVEESARAMAEHLAAWVDMASAKSLARLADSGIEPYAFDDATLAVLGSSYAAIQRRWRLRMVARRLPAEETLERYRTVVAEAAGAGTAK